MSTNPVQRLVILYKSVCVWRQYAGEVVLVRKIDVVFPDATEQRGKLFHDSLLAFYAHVMVCAGLAVNDVSILSGFSVGVGFLPYRNTFGVPIPLVLQF